MNRNPDEAQDAVATLKTVKRVVIGTGMVVIALMIGGTLISLASLAGLVGQHSIVHDLGQLIMVLGAGILFTNTAFLLAIYGWRKRAPVPAR